MTLAAVRLDGELVERARDLGVAVDQQDLDAGSDDDVAWLTGIARGHAADWVIVDGYRFAHRYQQALVAAGLRVAFVDDHGSCERYDAHVVINQNPYAAEAMYEQRGPTTRLLLGPGYALLRREFAAEAARHVPRLPARAARILVTLGGADPEDAASRVLDALARLPGDDVQVQVVHGPSRRARESVARPPVSRDSRVAMLPAAKHMVPLMAWADVAITGAGSTVYELCCLGVPTLVVAITRMQAESARALEREGLAVNLGWHGAMDAAATARAIAAVCDDVVRRADLARHGRARVDGRGASRVADALAAA